MAVRLDFRGIHRHVNQSFYPLLRDRNRFNILKGGAGSGKSVFGHQRMLYRFLVERGHNAVVIRKVGATIGISCWPLTMQLLADWNAYPLTKINRSNATITNKLNGNEIKFMGLDDIEKIKSITFTSGPLTDILIEEATEITEEDFNQLNLRLRGMAIQPFQITMMFNPVSDMHWMKRRFYDNPGSKKKQITLHHSTYLDNRFIDDGYREQLEALKFEDRVYYEVYALGNWGSIGNLVFRNIELVDSIPYGRDDFDMVKAGQDFGYNHANAIELIGFKDGVKYSFAELHVRHMTNDEVIRENEKRNVLETWRECTCDSAEPKSIKEWLQKGYNVRGAVKGPDSVRQQIGWLNKGRWVIDRNACPGLASEVLTYKWRETKDGIILDEPVRYHDDGIAACRYAIEDLTEYRTSMLDVV